MTTSMERPAIEQATTPSKELVRQTGKYREFMDRQRLPQPSRAVPVAKRVVIEDAAKWAWLGVKLPVVVLSELKPIGLGIAKMAAAWYSWINCEKAEEHIKLLESPSSRLVEQITKKRSANRKISLAVALMLLAGGTVAAFMQPLALGLAGFAFVTIADLIGRKDKPAVVKAPEPHRMVINEGTSYSAIAKEFYEVVAPRVGLDLGEAEQIHLDPVRKQFEWKVTCYDEITNDHVRAFERGLGAKPFTMRALHDEGDPATMRRIVMRIGDPLGEVVPAPWVPTGSVSIADPLEIGVSLTDAPFALSFADQHFKGIGSTGSGKSTWLIRNCIDRVSACHNAAQLGIDLHGLELDLWGDVIQRKAHTYDEAKALLEEVLAEISRRTSVLRGYATDLDPTNDHFTEWGEELAQKEGPAWIIWADEYHKIAAYPDLLEMCETVVREGRKVWITLKAFSQKYGNSDFGSKVMTTQANVTIALACDSEDAVRIYGKVKRDAGWDPSILTPGTKDGDRFIRNDAGKCFVEAPRLTTPDVYSCFAPLDAKEVKTRALRRMQDGICPMYIGEKAEDRNIEDGIVITPLFAEMEGLFARHGEKLPTETILKHLRMVDPQAYGKWTGNELALALAPNLRPKKNLNIAPGYNPKGYIRSEFEAALRTLTGEG
jgi:hypothetical protein